MYSTAEFSHRLVVIRRLAGISREGARSHSDYRRLRRCIVEATDELVGDYQWGCEKAHPTYTCSWAGPQAALDTIVNAGPVGH